MKITFPYELEGVLYDVEFEYSPGIPGRPYELDGDPGDPPEDPEAEILHVFDDCGDDIFEKLSVQEAEDLLEACVEYGADFKEEPRDGY